MLIKLKLKQILNRIKLVHTKSTYSEDYNKGFKHAIDLFAVAMDVEFGKWCEDQENLHEQIRQLRLQVLGENGEKAKLLFEINRLKSQPIRTIELPNAELNKIVSFLLGKNGLNWEQVKNHLVVGVKFKRTLK